jgi:hypothetical protein
VAEKSYARLRVFTTQDFRSSVVSAVAMLASFGLAWLLESLAGLNADVPVLAVVLSLSLGRTKHGRGAYAWLFGLVTLAVIAVGSAETGRLILHHPDAGDVAFTLALGASIWIRRFGAGATKAGTLIAMPFIAILVTPLPQPPGQGGTLWGAAAAAIAFLCVSGLRFASDRLGFTRAAPAPPQAERPSSPGVPVSTRMALQMVTALGAAFTVGRWAYPDHWPWLVLTAFIVTSGNRGRGDVLYKAGLRIAGAAAGTAVATLLAGAFGRGDPRSVAIILSVLAVAIWLRTINYAYWAASATGALALLYGYFGQTGNSLLQQRLGAIVVGAVLAVTASWLVLPVRSTQVLRRRTADVLAVLTDLSTAVRKEPERVPHHQARFQHALGRVDEVARPLQAHRLLTRRWRSGPHPADAVDVARGCAQTVAELGTENNAPAELTRARSELGRILTATQQRPAKP